MKIKTSLLLLFTAHALSAQGIDLNVIYENAETLVETNQQGPVRITVTNPTSQNISVYISKSFNVYSENSTTPHVDIYNPNEAQITDTCQWQYSAYSPWPSWTDGMSLNIRIDDIPALSSVTCVGEYSIGLVAGEVHTIQWNLAQASSSTTLDSQSNTFRAGPMPQPTQVPTTQWWSNLLLALMVLITSYILLPQLTLRPNKK